MLPSIFVDRVTIKRRIDTISASRDALNNPVYGDPVTNSPWDVIYKDMPCKLAFSSKEMVFVSTGERVTPGGIMYIPAKFKIYQNDRVYYQNGNKTIQWIITDVAPGYLMGKTLSHFEAKLILP
jgi:hypothetical protein